MKKEEPSAYNKGFDDAARSLNGKYLPFISQIMEENSVLRKEIHRLQQRLEGKTPAEDSTPVEKATEALMRKMGEI